MAKLNWLHLANHLAEFGHFFFGLAKYGHGPKGWGPEGVGAWRGWGPEGWGAQNFALFFSLPPEISFFLLSLGGLLVEFSWCLMKRRGAQVCTFGVLGLSRSGGGRWGVRRRRRPKSITRTQGTRKIAQNKENRKKTAKDLCGLAKCGHENDLAKFEFFWPNAVLAKCGLAKCGHDRWNCALRLRDGAHWGSWAHRRISQCCGLSPRPHPRPLALAVCSCDAEVVVRRQTAGLPDLVWNVTERLRSLTLGRPRPSQHLGANHLELAPCAILARHQATSETG